MLEGAVGEEMCWGLTYRVNWAAARPAIDEKRVRRIEERISDGA